LTRCEFEFVEKLAEYVITIILVDIFSNLCSDLEKTSFSTDLFWIQDPEKFHLKQNQILQTSFKSKNKLDRWQSTKRLNRKLNPRQISK